MSNNDAQRWTNYRQEMLPTERENDPIYIDDGSGGSWVVSRLQRFYLSAEQA